MQYSFPEVFRDSRTDIYDPCPSCGE